MRTRVVVFPFDLFGGAVAVGIYLMVGLAGHRNWGLSNTVLDYIVLLPRALPGTSIDPDARPSFGEACEVLRGRLDAVGAYADGVTAEELDRPVDGHAKTVGGALHVLFTELRGHNAFVNRDLDIIERA